MATGRTVLEWLEAWRDGRFDKTATGATERYEQALDLEREMKEMSE